MAHRLNDIRHLDRFDPKIRKMIARETFHMYTSFAGRLGLNVWRHEMETVCFKILYPKVASHLEEKFAAKRELDLACLNVTRRFLIKKLRKYRLKASVEYRIKSLYSTYRKMMFKKRKFEELTDRLAIRILVNKIEDCYQVLGIVHKVMHPIPGKLKDYIGTPKENGYQSIHTVVYPMPGITEQPIEIQIRTREIHKASEYGISAHYQYKDSVYSLQSGATQVNLFRNLEILRREVASPQQFEAALRTYFDENRLLIFDEKNNLYHIKRPASALDFAFQVHIEKFSHIRSIVVNGRIDSFDRLLKDGDVVRVNFSDKPTLRKEWINACLQNQTKKFIKYRNNPKRFYS
jgi:GTP pyrophosphokinase